MAKKREDHVMTAIQQTPLWCFLQTEEDQAKTATYLGIEEPDIPDDKVEAYRLGYINAFYEVRRMMYSIKEDEQHG